MTTDLRHAFRLLWKSKRITATTLVTLALCIGATTAIFSSVYSLMLKPLPYQEPERIVELYTSAVKAGLNHMPANVPFYLDYSQNATSYESLGLWSFSYSLVGENDSVARLPGARATAEIFTILRIQPLIGTFFTKDQNRPGADKVVVLTQSYWQTQYQESPEVLGKDIRIDDEAYKIIGVAPRVLEAFDARMKFVAPLSWAPAAENPQGRYGVGTQLFGRLKPGVTTGQANAEAKNLEKRYVDAGPPPLKAFVDRSGHDDERRRIAGAARRAGADDAADAPGRRRVRAAHRLRERRQSSAGAFQRSSVRVGHPIRARGRPRDDCPAAPARKPVVDVARRGPGAGRGLGRAADHEFLPGEDAAAVAAGVARLARARIRRRAHRRRRHAHRPDLGVSHPAHESRGGDPEQLARRLVRAAACAR